MRKIKEFFVPIVVGLVSSSVVLGVRATGLLQVWEWAAYDRFVQGKPSGPIEERIVLVGISEEDVQKAKTYPFSDGLWAEFLKKLEAQQPRVIGLDIFRDQRVPPGSADLEKVFKTQRNLIGIAKLPPSPVPPPPILKEKQQYGDVSGSPDLDGVNRRAFLYPISELGNPDSEIPSFALKLSYLYLNKEGIVDQNSTLNPKWLQLGKAHFRPFESHDGSYVGANSGGYRILINWRKPPQQFREVQFFDVIDGKIPSGFFQDRLVIVGASGLSFNDFHETPFTAASQETVRGIDLHAQVASGIIGAALGERSLIQVIPDFLEVILTVAFAVVSALVLWKWPSVPKHLIAASLSIGSTFSIVLVLLSYLAFLGSWWIPVVPSLIAVWIACTHTAYFLYSDQLKKINDNLEKLVQERTEDLRIAHQQILKEEKLAITQKLIDTLEREITSPANNLDLVLRSLEQLSHLATSLNFDESQQELLKSITAQIKQSQQYLSRLNFIFGRQPLLQERIPYELVSDANLDKLLETTIEFNKKIVNQKYFWTQESLSIYYSCRLHWQLSTDFNFRRYLVYILSHLFENAIESIDAKNPQAGGWIKIWITGEKDALIIEVKDNGIGMISEERERACEPFFSRKDRVGLGLYFCQEIIKKYAGRMTINSEKDIGTEIRVDFPLT
ncbi:CHASE2 domain-containing protein [Crocosphaera sp. XPORK-15E]|uniref:CHASE2 domain-containing protein n=1 Tax=Crocosphaera sp. XPORK-15E TaxID=3110247 RepID=UPI002B1F8C89|nr:CHASE2 domain-containing protein [Crocosphaera sp. XPORK-15E]MEA5537361.1 CHASE2 domain-containing protein [Crocosphaera sp. XPORK-15E]